MERPTRLTAFDAQVARRVATIIALEISARRRSTELHAQGAETLVRDLLTGLGDEQLLSRRAALQGLALDEPHVLCLLSDEREQPWSGPTPAAITELLGAEAVTFVTSVPDGLLVALRSDGGDDVALARGVVDGLLGAMPDGVRAEAALSGVLAGVPAFARGYLEVRKVTRCLRTFSDGSAGRVLGIEELGAGCVFLASTTRDEADEFVRHTLGPLLAQRERSTQDLLGTLALFFLCSRNIRDTAERVGVHENTIRYRLARVAELTGLDVTTNADHQLAGHMATLILRLEGVLPQPAPVVASTI